ncbi:hypothetical protein BDV06DRAFT_202282, partial [Aspergillus oleicola]
MVAKFCMSIIKMLIFTAFSNELPAVFSISQMCFMIWVSGYMLVNITILTSYRTHTVQSAIVPSTVFPVARSTQSSRSHIPCFLRLLLRNRMAVGRRCLTSDFSLDKTRHDCTCRRTRLGSYEDYLRKVLTNCTN